MLDAGLDAIVAMDLDGKIIEFNRAMSVFALFAVAWFGSGLLCEDRRVGAHQLYFSRPLTRIDYYLGKFLTVGFFGALAILVPGLVICFIASWSSPDWSFLKEEGDVVLRTIAYALVWIVVACSITLCSSSLFPRRSFALAGIVGFTMILEALSHILAEFVDQRLLPILYLRIESEDGSTLLGRLRGRAFNCERQYTDGTPCG